jgi:5-methylcytosine-specific restriction endonuclease McrA
VSDRRSRAMPLEEFGTEHRAQIEWDVAQPEPPARYRSIGDPRKPTALIENRSWWEWHWQRDIDPDKRRTKLPRWVRERIITRDGLVCGLCGGEVPPGDVHIDHIHPVARGGTDHPDNLQVAHSTCNVRKGARI